MQVHRDDRGRDLHLLSSPLSVMLALSYRFIPLLASLSRASSSLPLVSLLMSPFLSAPRSSNNRLVMADPPYRRDECLRIFPTSWQATAVRRARSLSRYSPEDYCAKLCCNARATHVLLSLIKDFFSLSLSSSFPPCNSRNRREC